MWHGTDPDHLTAIDGLSRIRPRATNGLFFALGHGTVVTALAAGVGHTVAGRAAFLAPWILIAIGSVNLCKVVRTSPLPPATKRPIVTQPFLLGMLLAAGIETSSQLSLLVLADQTNPWLLGIIFCGGMVVVDGLDGYLAASTQRLAATGEKNARDASRLLGVLVVIFSFALGGAELLGSELDRFAVPLGLALFGGVIVIRVWARSGSGSVIAKRIAEGEPGVSEPARLEARRKPQSGAPLVTSLDGGVYVGKNSQGCQPVFAHRESDGRRTHVQGG
jgi:high-affinity nickel-transport protein